MKNSEKQEKKDNEYSIIINKSAQKFLNEIDDRNFERIDEKILNLKENPFPRNSKKLFLYECYRMRAGDYRILYTVNQEKCVITILDIDNRKDIYKKK